MTARGDRTERGRGRFERAGAAAGGRGPADPVALRDLLGGATAKLGMRDPVATGRIWRAWPEIVGPAIAARAEPTSLRDGVLRVRAESPAWATEISYLADEIRRRADDVVGRGTVTEVRVWTGPPSEPRSRATGPVGPGAATSRPGERDAPGRAATGTGADDSAEPAPEDPMTALERAHEAWARRRARGR